MFLILFVFLLQHQFYIKKDAGAKATESEAEPNAEAKKERNWKNERKMNLSLSSKPVLQVHKD